MTVLSVLTEPLGGSPLAQAGIAGRDAQGWIVPRPADAAGWRARADAAVAAAGPGWGAALAPAVGEGMAAALEAHAAAGGIVVTTGQQPGLLGGPLYTLHKALTARALAAELGRVTGRPAMAVFWAATDDADIEEARVAMLAQPGGAVALKGPALGVEHAVMAERPLGDVTAEVALALQAAGPDADPVLVGALTAAYGRQGSVGGAYVQLLRTLLEPLGVAVLDAWHPALRRAAHPVLARALARAEAIAQGVHARDAAIRAAGLVPQVAEVAGLSHVFRLVDGTKVRVPLAEAAAAAARAEPGTLSANVLLRPVLEAQLLPTAAYVAGPGELAYFAQATAVAEALGVRAPLGVPRWSGTIVEPQVARMLERRGLTPDELADPHAAETARARAAVDAEAIAAFERLRAATDAEVTTLLARLPQGVPPRAVEGMRHQVHHRIARMERRLVAAAKRADEEMRRDVATARGALRPHGGRQERAIAWFPYVARHGEGLLALLEEAIAPHAASLVGG